MKLSIRFPPVSPAVTAGKVSEWHLQVGEAVSYGDHLFDVTIISVAIAQRELGARLRRFVKAKARKLPEVSVVYRITSMDAGTLSAITASTGTSIDVGDPVGEIDTHDGSDKAGEARTSFDVVRANPGAEA